MAGVRGLGHIALGVRDLDAAIAFYRDVIGFTVSVVDHEVIAARPASPAVDRLAAYLHCGPDPLDGFIVIDQQPEPFGAPAELWQLGYHHFAVWVEDLDAVVDRARSKGVEPFIGPLDIGSPRYGEPEGERMRTALFKDPEGNVVQCDERLDS